jgi:hypothetical protein
MARQVKECNGADRVEIILKIKGKINTLVSPKKILIS